MQMRTIMTTLSKNKIVLGLSGGVDSTTAALLLKDQGFEGIGFYFDVMGDNADGKRAAEELAEKMEIPLHIMDVSEEFSKSVIDNFCSQYACGRTPNPCVVCNPAIKFKKLLEIADRENAYYIATGHYVGVTKDDTSGIYYIQKGSSEKKDQSYMLYRLGQQVLSRLILPLADMKDKDTVRRLARENDMPNAQAADSQEICFIDEEKEDYVSFMEARGFACSKGHFVDAEGKILGEHQGINRYTVGQRKGLGIALGKPVFVTKIDKEKNQVVLGDNADLFHTEVVSAENFFTETGCGEIPERLLEKQGITAKIRYAAKPAPAVLHKTCDGRVVTVFEQPQRAATPGQSIVFYDGDRVVGGGFIEPY